MVVDDDVTQEEFKHAHYVIFFSRNEAHMSFMHELVISLYYVRILQILF